MALCVGSLCRADDALLRSIELHYDDGTTFCVAVDPGLTTTFTPDGELVFSTPEGKYAVGFGRLSHFTFSSAAGEHIIDGAGDASVTQPDYTVTDGCLTVRSVSDVLILYDLSGQRIAQESTVSGVYTFRPGAPGVYILTTGKRDVLKIMVR